MKIAFLGDSLTWGGYGGDYVAEVAGLLPQHEIVNAGVGGNTVINLHDRLDGVLHQNPDGIFVMVGGNDAISYSQPGVRQYYEMAQSIPDGQVTPEVFSHTYRDLLTRFQRAQVLAWVGLEPSEYSAEMVAVLQSYNDRAREVAQALGVPVLDLMSHFTPEHLPSRPPLTMEHIRIIGQRTRNGWMDYESERSRNGYTFTFDGMHITPDCARHMAELIVDFLAV